MGLVTETPPVVMVAVTVEESLVTTLPLESSTLITGWVDRAAPEASVLEGAVEITSLVAAPVARVMVLEAALVKVPLEKVSVVVAPLSPLRVSPLKVATPAVMVAVAPAEMVGAPVEVAVMVPVALVTTLPPESSTLATGWTDRAAPLVALEEGWVVMTTWVAAPAETVMVPDTAVVSAPSEKVSV